MCRKNHTLAATWDKPADGDKSITGCTSGQPLILIHEPNGSATAAIYFRPKENCVGARTTGDHNYFGTHSSHSQIIIPTASSCTITVVGGTDDKIYVYRS